MRGKLGFFEHSYHILGIVRDPSIPDRHGTLSIPRRQPNNKGKTPDRLDRHGRESIRALCRHHIRASVALCRAPSADMVLHVVRPRTTRCCNTVQSVPRHTWQHSSPCVYPGTELTHFTENVDIFPTIAEALGHPVPAQCDGSALGPLLRGQPAPHWRTAATYARTQRRSRLTGLCFVFLFAFGPGRLQVVGAQHACCLAGVCV